MLKQCDLNKMSNSYVLEYYKDEKKLESRGAIILDGALSVVKVRFALACCHIVRLLSKCSIVSSEF